MISCTSYSTDGYCIGMGERIVSSRSCETEPLNDTARVLGGNSSTNLTLQVYKKQHIFTIDNQHIIQYMNIHKSKIFFLTVKHI